MANPLEAIVIEQTTEPRELPRLHAAGVFLHYLRISSALEKSKFALDQMPNATSQQFNALLKDIMQQCEVASKAAARLREANE